MELELSNAISVHIVTIRLENLNNYGEKLKRRCFEGNIGALGCDVARRARAISGLSDCQRLRTMGCSGRRQADRNRIDHITVDQAENW